MFSHWLCWPKGSTKILCSIGGLSGGDALKIRFPARWQELALQAGQGIRQLLKQDRVEDFDEALHTCAYGLLASQPPTRSQLHVMGERLLVDAIEPLEKLAGA